MTQYHIRIRGEIRGPVSEQKLIGQIRRKRISRHHEVSIDGGATWSRAGEHDNLFAPTTPPAPVLVATPPETPPEPAVEAAVEWFYAFEDQRLGPVTEQDIRVLARAGSLGPDDLVWNESFAEWVPVSQVPCFAEAVRQTPGRSRSDRAGADVDSDDGDTSATVLPLALFSALCGLFSLLAVTQGLLTLGWLIDTDWIVVRGSNSGDFARMAGGSAAMALFPVAAALAAVLSAHQARRHLRAHPGRTGGGYATVAFALGYTVLVGAGLSLLAALVILVVKATQ